MTHPTLTVVSCDPVDQNERQARIASARLIAESGMKDWTAEAIAVHMLQCQDVLHRKEYQKYWDFLQKMLRLVVAFEAAEDQVDGSAYFSDLITDFCTTVREEIQSL